ncbi:hypothetical protein [Streptomyces sp. NPDC091259]|uniref:hypothetical protein n=1 Tax=Streptomyces sp. NPDC091259 TaxID=3365976 RepID=UPI003817C6A9
MDHVGSVRRMEDGGYQMVMWGTDPLHRIWCTFGPPEAAKVADMTPPLDGLRGYPTPREWPPDFTGVIRP